MVATNLSEMADDLYGEVWTALTIGERSRGRRLYDWVSAKKCYREGNEGNGGSVIDAY